MQIYEELQKSKLERLKEQAHLGWQLNFANFKEPITFSQYLNMVFGVEKDTTISEEDLQNPKKGLEIAEKILERFKKVGGKRGTI